MNRQSISDRTRFLVFKRDNFTCQYCGRSGVELEVDHIRPVSKGGSNDMDNLITSCKSCNRGKIDTEVIPTGCRLVKETKSKRLQLLIRPVVYEYIKEEAKRQNQSINNYVCELFEKEFGLYSENRGE